MSKYPHIIVPITNKSYDLIGVVAKVSNAMYHGGASMLDVIQFTRKALMTKNHDAIVRLAEEFVTIS
jgi:predicted amino acid-binding ACT domain protein